MFLWIIILEIFKSLKYHFNFRFKSNIVCVLPNELDIPYALHKSAIYFYQKNRYIKLKQVFS